MIRVKFLSNHVLHISNYKKIEPINRGESYEASDEKFFLTSTQKQKPLNPETNCKLHAVLILVS